MNWDPNDEKDPHGEIGKVFQAQGTASTQALRWEWAPSTHKTKEKAHGLGEPPRPEGKWTGASPTQAL